MSYNITGLDPELFYAVNSVLHIMLAVAFPLPTFILCGVCVMALIYAKGIDWKMKAILINILTPEIANSMAVFFLDFGYPIRAFTGSGNDLSCNILFSLITVGYFGTIAFTPFFSVTVYTFVKYDAKKLKWYGIVTFLIISWMIILAVGISSFVDTSGEFSVNGFCVIVYDFSGGSSFVVIILTILPAIIIVVGLSIVIIFSILTYCHVKKNTISPDLETPSPVKRAIAKVLFFHATKIFFIMAVFTVTFITLFFQPSIEEDAGIIVVLIIEYGIRKFFYEFTTFLTPVISIIFLKPIRDALKQICFPCKKSAVQPSQ